MKKERKNKMNSAGSSTTMDWSVVIRINFLILYDYDDYNQNDDDDDK